jgi:hypothetical protein
VNLFYLSPVWKEVLKKLDDLGLVPSEDGRHRLHVLWVRHKYLEHVEGLRQIILLGNSQHSFRYPANGFSLIEKVFTSLHSIFTFLQQIFPLVHSFPFFSEAFPMQRIFLLLLRGVFLSCAEFSFQALNFPFKRGFFFFSCAKFFLQVLNFFFQVVYF